MRAADPIGGPAYLAGPWVRTAGPVGGLGYDIRFNFADPDTWYVTDAWAGIHMSTDDGRTWVPSNAGIDVSWGPTGDVLPVFSATVDPIDPTIVWIGTQDTGNIFRSVDGGVSWTQRDNGVDPDLRPLSFRGFTIDPTNSDIVFAMAEISSPGWTPDGSQQKGLEQDRTQGIVYKTIDGGQTWQEIWRGDNLARYAWIDPRDTNVVYVSTGIFDREAANTDVTEEIAGGVGILKSMDGGATWQVQDERNGLADLYVGSLFMSPADPDVLLAAASQNNWSGYNGRHTEGVYRTEDGGEHWERVIAQPELYSSVEFCLSDPDVAYAASSAAVHRSDDAGLTWERFTKGNDTWGPPGIIAGFPIDLQCDPDDPDRIFANNYLGGNFLSVDGGRTWVTASDGYSGALVSGLAVDAENPWRVYAGNRTGLFRSDDGGAVWWGLAYPPATLPARFNEIVAVAVDPEDSDHVLTVPGDAFAVFSSRNGGVSWELTGAVQAVALSFAPSDSQVVYAAVGADCNPLGDPLFTGSCRRDGDGLYVSGDGGDSWQAAPGNGPGRPIVAMAVDPANPDIVFASDVDDGLVKTTDGGASWSEAAAGLPDRLVRSLAIHPGQPDVLLAGLRFNAIWKSTDGGSSWRQTSAGLPAEADPWSIVFDPSHPEIVYAADLLSGVYVSTDTGETWQAINDGLTHRAAKALSISADGSVLYLGVQGDAVYRLGTPAGDPRPVPPPQIQGPDSVGLVDPSHGKWYLRDSDTLNVTSFYYGIPGDTPLMGDWNCDGIDTVAMYRESTGFVYYRNSNDFGVADDDFFFGIPGDVPIAGDWDGDGCDSFGIYRSGHVFLSNVLETAFADLDFYFGVPGDRPFAGDFDGDGIDEIGLYRESTGLFYYRNTLDTGVADDQFYFGNPGDQFVAGDWGTIDGVETPAVFRPSTTTFYFLWTNTQGVADSEFIWGEGDWLPVSGALD